MKRTSIKRFLIFIIFFAASLCLLTVAFRENLRALNSSCNKEPGKTNFCFKEINYNLKIIVETAREPWLYNLIMKAVKTPELDKRTFAKPSNSTRLEVVLIDLKPAESPLLLPTMYNIANIYGGRDIAFTLMHNSVNDHLINQEDWPNVSFRRVEGEFAIADYNKMLTTKPFWDTFQAEYILITHTDSILFRALDEDMFGYDLIGSPWPDFNAVNCGDGRPRVGNGGYTLRRVQTAKDTLAHVFYVGEAPEDVWWCSKVANLPSMELASRFAVEMSDQNLEEGVTPTAIHQFGLSEKWGGGLLDHAGDWLRVFLDNNTVD